MSTFEIRQGDALDLLQQMRTGSVHIGITSPPYLALRDYGIPPRLWPSVEYVPMAGLPSVVVPPMECAFGLEPDVSSYIAHLVLIFREVGRVLRKDGSLWLNLGDSYVAGPTGHQDISNANGKAADMFAKGGRYRLDNLRKDVARHRNGLKPKDLMMVPARAALALQADGWWLRSAITWLKRAPMPESCKDRPTSATEMIYLLTRSGRYFYDADAVRERLIDIPHVPGNKNIDPFKTDRGHLEDRTWGNEAGRNMWNYITHPWTAEDDAWLLSPQSFSDAHFATFPSELPRRAILAGTSAFGVCAYCGGPYKRVVERVANYEGRQDRGQPNGVMPQVDSSTWRPATVTDKGWAATCKCPQDKPPVPAIVLDPFCGAGTTGLVALRHGRRFIGLELNADYIRIATQRIIDDSPMFNQPEPQEATA